MSTPCAERLFFAIDLPDPYKKEFARLIGHLKKSSKTNAIRWTKLDNLHITLHFMAEVQKNDIQTLISKVRHELAHFREGFVLKFQKINLFPSPYRPRVIVLEIDSQALLTQLVDRIGHVINGLKYELDTRPYRPHLTLGRIKHTHMKLDFLEEINTLPGKELKVEEVTLFRSEPQQNGSKYTAIATFSLTEEAHVKSKLGA